ncbi:MAG: hypothetical protein HRU19_00790 [Pseudobacteriovorax sp.]|nr:hypothetical protein [Pseudobacteriovorax sp.]
MTIHKIPIDLPKNTKPINKKLWLIAVSLLFSNAALAVDLVKCHRENPRTRQFCYIDSKAFQASVEIKTEVTAFNETFNIEPILTSGSIELNEDQLELPGVLPTISYSTKWSNEAECVRNGLWQHNIHMQVLKSDGENTSLGQIGSGTTNYEIYMDQYLNENQSPFTHSVTGNTVELTVAVAPIDFDFSSELPLPQERIPSSCKLNFSSFEIGYDPIKINQTSKFLKQLSLAKSDFLTKSAIVHGMIIDSRNGAKCSISRLENSLRNAEFLTDSDSSDLLSLSSIDALKTALIEAKNLGNFAGIDEENLWNHYLSNSSLIQTSCDGNRDYTVNIEEFLSNGNIINQQGYNNAKRFFEERENLKKLLATSLALIEVSKIGLEEDLDILWPENDPRFYANF